MSKVDDNKKQKESTLLETAFHLFTGKGFAKTTISDIVQQAGLAKGTFYLYFKDKYDLRDKLIVYKANQLFDDAHRALEKANVSSFENDFKKTTSSWSLLPKTYHGGYLKVSLQTEILLSPANSTITT